MLFKFLDSMWEVVDVDDMTGVFKLSEEQNARCKMRSPEDILGLADIAKFYTPEVLSMFVVCAEDIDRFYYYDADKDCIKTTQFLDKFEDKILVARMPSTGSVLHACGVEHTVYLAFNCLGAGAMRGNLITVLHRTLQGLVLKEPDVAFRPCVQAYGYGPNVIYRVDGEHYMCFDENGMWVRKPLAELVGKEAVLFSDGAMLERANKLGIKVRAVYCMVSSGDGAIEQAAMNKLRRGSNVEDFINYIYGDAMWVRKPSYTLVESVRAGFTKWMVYCLLSEIEKPEFHLLNSGDPASSFDFITVRVHLSNYFQGNTKTYVKEHISDISSLVVRKLASNTEFKKFGVPVNVLKIKKIDRTGNMLRYDIGLKPVSSGVGHMKLG